jgi:hypothetical protein
MMTAFCARPGRSLLPAIALAVTPFAATLAHEPLPPGAGVSVSGGHGGPIRADGHAPIGVMGDHPHKKGHWMLSYRYMYMDMRGNRIGANGATPQTIVTSVPNRFASLNPPSPGQPPQPPTLRVVPLWMTMQMQMLGAMYAPTDDTTLMSMVPYIDKEMRHVTYAGGAGTAIKGYFTTNSEGFGDTRVTALHRLYDDDVDRVHLNLGLSLPTGSVTERGTLLTPAPNPPFNDRPNARLPYAMQLGTGTYDLLAGLTYRGRSNDLSWGAQFRSEIRLGDNDEGYAWGDLYGLTGWLAYEWKDWLSTSVRLDGWTQEDISRIDPAIVGSLQTANPDFYGGQQLFAYLGANIVGETGIFRGHRLAFEVGVPLYRDLNGPQLETDWNLIVGWQKAF